ncbi:hypothetical protein MTO96_022079 [Rhipicephalus appendiculatus]
MRYIHLVLKDSDQRRPPVTSSPRIWNTERGSNLGCDPSSGTAAAPSTPPENTLAAFQEAKKNNADGIEFDLTFTRDNVAVIFHDDTLERTTNGEGPIDNITFEELRRLDASCKHPNAKRFPKERVPTLEEGVEECLRLGMRMIIDVKKYNSRAVEVVDKLFREKPELYGRALVASFHHNFVYALRSQNRRIVTALTWRPGYLAYEDINNTRPRREKFLAHLFDRMADWLFDKALHYGLLPFLTGASAVLISDNMIKPRRTTAHGCHPSSGTVAVPSTPPENTLAAFKEAKTNSADGIEFDLSFTNDNVAVIFHDDTLERTTNGEGPIENITFQELRRLDASCKHPLAERFPKERVPTLEEGIEECLRLGMRIIIDVKNHDSRAVEVVDKLFREEPELYGRALVASFYHNFVYFLRRRNPEIVTALTWRPGFLAYEDINNTRPRHEKFLAHMFDRMTDWLLDKALHTGLLPYLTGASAVLISSNMMSAEYVKAWRNRGIHVITWTPNHPTEKEFFRQSLRVSVITDSMHPV